MLILLMYVKFICVVKINQYQINAILCLVFCGCKTPIYHQMSLPPTQKVPKNGPFLGGIYSVATSYESPINKSGVVLLFA